MQTLKGKNKTALKIFFVFFAFLTFLFFSFKTVKADGACMTTTSCAVKSQVECESTPNATYRGEGTTCPSWCADPTNPDCCDESFKGEIGLVP